MKPSSRWTPYLFIAPALCFFAFAVLVPMIGTIIASLFQWDGFHEPIFVGLRNYGRAFQDTIFLQSFLHVGVYVIVTIFLEVAIGLILAGIVTSRKGFSGYRIALFIPVLLPTVVISVLWRFVFNADFGLIKGILDAIGKPEWNHVWLGDTRFALLAICFVSGWIYAGFYLAIFYAGLQRVPKEITEAAEIDGAKSWNIFWKIKVPMIRRVWEVSLLICITGGVQGFDLFYIMTNGGPYYATEVPTTYMVRSVFRDGEVGFGSSMAVIVTSAVLLVGFIYSKVRTNRSEVIEY
ncbi:MAG: sugar ABC transporter permease [Actinomycetes bacterium]